jgi:hypothetical protein
MPSSKPFPVVVFSSSVSNPSNSSRVIYLWICLVSSHLVLDGCLALRCGNSSSVATVIEEGHPHLSEGASRVCSGHAKLTAQTLRGYVCSSCSHSVCSLTFPNRAERSERSFHRTSSTGGLFNTYQFLTFCWRKVRIFARKVRDINRRLL